MALARITPKPGFDSQQTQTLNIGGWFNGNLIRWRMGLLEKMGGWSRLISSTLAEHARAMKAWLDLDNHKNLLIGTDAGPQIIVDSTLYTLSTIQFLNSQPGIVRFSVTVGTAVVTVQSLVPPPTGSIVTFLMRASIGGIIVPAGTKVAVTGTTANTFTFNLASNATSTQTAVTAVPQISWSFPSTLFTVQFIGHGQIVGSTFPIDQTTTILQGAGSSDSYFISIPAGTSVTVASVIDANNFTFDWSPYGSGVRASSSSGSIFEGVDQQNGTFGEVLAVSVPSAPRTTTGTSWFTDNQGAYGLAVYTGSPLFVFVPPVNRVTPYIFNIGLLGSPITSPQINNGMFVAMPQAQVIVFGTEAVMGGGVQDPLLLRFSDAGTLSGWSASVTNQAGSYRLSRGSKIVAGIQAPQTTLLLTDTDAWSMSYIGPPLIYGFAIMGSGCGAVAPHGVATLGRVTYWIGNKTFWQFSEAGVRPLPCPVWDFIFRDLDTANIGKCHAGVSSETNEVYFFFPSLTDKPTAKTNALLFTQTFGQTPPWNITDVTPTGGFTAPDGSVTAQKLVEGTSTFYHGVEQDLSTTITAGTISIYCHKNSTRSLELSIASDTGGAQAIFDPTTGGTSATLTYGGFAITASGSTTDALATGLAGNGWLRYYLQVTTDGSSEIGVLFRDANGTNIVYAGGGVAGVIVWGAQVNSGALATYQFVGAEITNECTRYVKYNAVEGLWDTGAWPGSGVRTAWIDDNIFGSPLGADGNFRIQQHEQGYDDDGSPMRGVFAETGYSELGDGTVMMSCSQCQPDFKWFGNNGGVRVSLKSAGYPGSKQHSFGPFSVTPTTQFFNPRMRGRLVAVRYDWEALTGFSARVGATAFRISPSGRRP